MFLKYDSENASLCLKSLKCLKCRRLPLEYRHSGAHIAASLFSFLSINIQFFSPQRASVLRAARARILSVVSDKWKLATVVESEDQDEEEEVSPSGWTFFSRWRMPGIIFSGFSEIISPGSTLCRCAVAALPLSSLFYTLAENVLNPLCLWIYPLPSHLRGRVLPAPGRRMAWEPPAKSSDAKCVWRYPSCFSFIVHNALLPFPCPCAVVFSGKVARILADGRWGGRSYERKILRERILI